MIKKILIIFGTRPEAIKVAPLIKALEKDPNFSITICVTAQHREMLDQVLHFFDITPDYDLDIMKKNQDLYSITSNVLLGIKDILLADDPDLVLVHGDTTTTMAGALSAFYQQIPVGHIEAGLRTWDIYSPWPEEANRQLTSRLASYHFSPTVDSKKNLLQENIEESRIVITGNTVIDALFLALDIINSNTSLKQTILHVLNKVYPLNENRKFILVTGHRRENFGQDFIQVFQALKQIALDNPHIDIIYPVHLNPYVYELAHQTLNDIQNIYLIKPLTYEVFVYLMSQSYFIITDSGGIQEEAPSLGKPVLVTRKTTERPEAIQGGTVKLVGTDTKTIIFEAQNLLDNKDQYEKMSHATNVYGNGQACLKIIEFLKETKLY